MKLKGRLRFKSIQAIVVVMFLFSSLRVINWFQYPYILASGDFRPPFLNEAFTSRVSSTWDEIDFGMPSIYSPRILDPFYFLMTVFQTFGLSLFLSEIVTVSVMYFLSSILMYVFVKQLTGNNITASFMAAIFMTSNVFLVNDREITAVGFIDTVLIILPGLIAFFRGLKTNSYKLIAISGMLSILTYATFPNYRTTLLSLIMFGLVSIFLSIGRKLPAESDKRGLLISYRISLSTKSLYRYIKGLAVFAAAFLLASIWIITIIVMNFGILTATYAAMNTPEFIVGLTRERAIYDVTRLIVKWAFYSGALGKPYIPYGIAYSTNPLLIILSYLPATIAFASLLFSKQRKVTIFFGIVAIVSLFLASGLSFNEYGNQLYSAIVGLPLLRAFREASNWMFFAVISLSILIGCTVSALCNRISHKALQFIAAGLMATLFISAAYPLVTGDVARNWLKPEIKGSTLPSSYFELNNMLSSEYWAIMLPQRGTYVIYNFSGVPFSSGNPYPLIFSKPVITGSGTEYIQSSNQELINRLHQLLQTNLTQNRKFLGILGVKYLVLDKDLISGNVYDANALDLGQNENFVLVKEWNEVVLFNNTYAVQKVYAADNLLDYTTLNDMHDVAENSDWNVLDRSVFLNSTSLKEITNKTLTTPENLVWQDKSPTNYEASATSKGPFVLVFLESYSSNWKLYVNGGLLPEANHLEVNSFANGWLIDNPGNITIRIEYQTQNLLVISTIASVLLPMGLLMFLSRKDIRKAFSSIAQKSLRKNGKE